MFFLVSNEYQKYIKYNVNKRNKTLFGTMAVVTCWKLCKKGRLLYSPLSL